MFATQPVIREPVRFVYNDTSRDGGKGTFFPEIS